MKETMTRDLVALSAIAFNQGDYETAATLFTQAMNCEDSGSFLNDLLEDNVTCHVLAESLVMSTEEGELNSISSTIAKTIRRDVGSESSTDRKQSLRDDDDDGQGIAHDLSMQTFESKATNVKSPLSIKLKD